VQNQVQLDAGRIQTLGEVDALLVRFDGAANYVDMVLPKCLDQLILARNRSQLRFTMFMPSTIVPLRSLSCACHGDARNNIVRPNSKMGKMPEYGLKDGTESLR
jgi:hypothetical protein